jgi:hypothetical protein
MADDAATSSGPVHPAQKSSHSWITTLILYPTLATSLFAAVPTIWNEYKAFRLGIASGEVQLVKEQEQLWESNLECLTESGIYEIDGPGGLVVKATLCTATGDALLRYYFNDWTPVYKWVKKPAPHKKKV